MHPIEARLLGIALGASALTGCRSVCHTPFREARTTFAALSERAPGLVADSYTSLGLAGGRFEPQREACEAACGPNAKRCWVDVKVTGAPRPTATEGVVTCVYPLAEECHLDFDPLHLGSCPSGCGRLPASVPRAPRAQGADPVTRHVAEIAALEALAVIAFAELGADLAEHGLLDDALAARVERAKADERRHTRAALRALSALGGTKPRVPRVRRAPRSLEELALHNAREGCAREAFGAVIARLQADTAHDPALRALYRAVADDELAHAALAWDVHARIAPRLPDEARARVASAHREALAELADAPAPPTSLARRAGYPAPDVRAAIARAIADALPLEGAA